MMFIVGIDVAKRGHEVCIITDSGDVVAKPFSIKNNCTGYNLMMEKVRLQTRIRNEVVFAMESTAHYWLALYTRLVKEGYKVVVLNPIQTSAMREMLIRKIKTDAKDALVIAEVIRFGHYSESNVTQDKMLALKELCRNRSYLVDMASDLKRKITAIIDRIFPEYETQFESIFSKTSIAVLKKYPTPQKMSNAHIDKLTEILQTASNGHFGEWKAIELKATAKNSFGIRDCEEVYSTLITIMLEEMQAINEKARMLEKRIEEIFKTLDSPITSIPGIGPLLGAAIISEIGDISRFQSADKLAAYIGVDPMVKQSGEYNSTNTRMSKRGSPYLRRVIWLASQLAVQHDPMFKAYYNRKAGQGMKYMTIIGHVTKKMTAVIFAILRDNKTYVPVIQAA